MAKIINMNGKQVEVVPLDEARTFYRGRNGNEIKLRSFLQKIYRGEIPQSFYTKTTRGNYWFDKNSLLGFTPENKRA